MRGADHDSAPRSARREVKKEVVSTDGIRTAATGRCVAAGGTAAQGVSPSRTAAQGRAPAGSPAAGHPPAQPGVADTAPTETGGAFSSDARPAIKHLSFLFYGKSGAPCLRIYNARTGELLKEIPPDLLGKHEGGDQATGQAAGTPRLPLDQKV